MASNSSTSGGYDCQFLEEPSDDLKCLICLCVARDPVQHGGEGCGRIYCKECISSYKKNVCPNCRKKITIFKDVRSERDIGSLRVKCPNAPCGWTGELRSLEQHSTTCDFVLISCPNECKDWVRKRSIDSETVRETTKVFRKDIKQHLKSECGRRQYKCPYCQETGEYNSITGYHKRLTCNKVTIECNNHGCKKTFLREAQKEHISICPYQRIPCKYKEFGCDTKPCRKDLQNHENDAQIHLRVTMDTLLAVQKQSRQCSTECSLLPAQLNTTAKESHRITFKMEKFRLYNGKEFYSPPFYSHPEGYKMIIKIFYADKNFRVKVYLMKGEYDNTLEFPFKGTVTVAILNQLQDDEHAQLSEEVTNDDDSITIFGNARVTDGDIGHFSMIDMVFPLNQLKQTISRLYFNNNAFIFGTSVQVPSYKPWLSCTAN